MTDNLFKESIQLDGFTLLKTHPTSQKQMPSLHALRGGDHKILPNEPQAKHWPDKILLRPVVLYGRLGITERIKTLQHLRHTDTGILIPKACGKSAHALLQLAS